MIQPRKAFLCRAEYRDKVLACWLGKNIGGTLGAPFEWRRQVNNVSFYTQDLSGEPALNDDLDVQLLWLVALEEMGIDVSPRALADYWCLYLTPHWSEYGTSKINMRSGLPPPLSGTLNNEYRHSCGAFIRSEIWACITPGCPDLAAQYAYNDAILDHGNGEGTYAEVFTATLESAAFVCSDFRELVEVGLSYLPPDCGVARAVRCAVDNLDAGKDWKEVREEILRHHRGGTAMNNIEHTSPADREKGFHEGLRGYDAPSNIAILVLGLLYGGDDFDKMICTTVNCGEDTDCTGATAGSVFGIMHGTKGIPEKWVRPIGHSIRTGCLNLGEMGYFGGQIPASVDELTDRTERVARQVLLRRREARLEISEERPTDLNALPAGSLRSADGGEALYASMTGPRFTFDFFDVDVDYGESPMIRAGQPKTIRITLHNRYKVQANVALHWYLPEGWSVRPAADGAVMSLPPQLGPPVTCSFELTADRLQRPVSRCVLELTVEARPTVLLVPLTLFNGNTLPFYAESP